MAHTPKVLAVEFYLVIRRQFRDSSTASVVGTYNDIKDAIDAIPEAARVAGWNMLLWHDGDTQKHELTGHLTKGADMDNSDYAIVHISADVHLEYLIPQEMEHIKFDHS